MAEEETAPFLTDAQIIVFSLLLGIWICLVLALIVYFKFFSPLARHRRRKPKQSSAAAASMLTLDSKEMVSNANELKPQQSSQPTQQSSDNVYEVLPHADAQLIDIEAARVQERQDHRYPVPAPPPLQQQQKQDPGKNYESLGPENLPPPPGVAVTAAAQSKPSKNPNYEYVQMGDLSRRKLPPPPPNMPPASQEQPSTSEDQKTDFEQPTSNSEKKSLSEKKQQKKNSSTRQKPVVTAVEKQVKPSEFHFPADKRTATTQAPSKESTRKKRTSATQHEATTTAENQAHAQPNLSKETIPGVKMDDGTLDKGGATTGGETEDVNNAAAAAQPVVIKAKKRSKSHLLSNGSSEKL